MDEGLTLETFYAEAICGPSRQSFMTGRQSGSWSQPWAYNWGLVQGFGTIAQKLKENGYNTHFAGKWHLGVHTTSLLPKARGFDESVGFNQKSNSPMTWKIDSEPQTTDCQTGEELYDIFIDDQIVNSQHPYITRGIGYVDRPYARASGTRWTKVGQLDRRVTPHTTTFDRIMYVYADNGFTNEILNTLLNNELRSARLEFSEAEVAGFGTMTRTTGESVTLQEAHWIKVETTTANLFDVYAPHDDTIRRRINLNEEELIRDAELLDERTRSPTFNIFKQSTVDFIRKKAADSLRYDSPFFSILSTPSIHGPWESNLRNRNLTSFYRKNGINNCDWFNGIVDDATRNENICNPRYLSNRFEIESMGNTVDEAIAEIKAALLENGVWDKTLLVFQSDNGGNLGTGNHNYPLRGGKNGAFDGGVRVRAAIGGGALPEYLKHKKNKAVFHTSDWYATFSYLAGSVDITGDSVWEQRKQRNPAPSQEFARRFDVTSVNMIPAIQKTNEAAYPFSNVPRLINFYTPWFGARFRQYLYADDMHVYKVFDRNTRLAAPSGYSSEHAFNSRFCRGNGNKAPCGIDLTKCVCPDFDCMCILDASDIMHSESIAISLASNAVSESLRERIQDKIRDYEEDFTWPGRGAASDSYRNSRRHADQSQMNIDAYLYTETRGLTDSYTNSNNLDILGTFVEETSFDCSYVQRRRDIGGANVMGPVYAIE